MSYRIKITQLKPESRKYSESIKFWYTQDWMWVAAYFDPHKNSKTNSNIFLKAFSCSFLEWYDYTSLGGYVIPIQFMTSDWSYFEFSHQFILMVIVWVNSAKEMTLSRFCILIDFDFITDFFLLNKHFICWGLYDIDRKNQNYGVIY